LGVSAQIGRLYRENGDFMMNNNGYLLELRDVTKKFISGDQELWILRGANVAIERAETIAIIGPSGCGKSTLLGLMAGLERVTSGEIWFEGQAIQDLNEDQLASWRRKDVGFVFQDFRLISSFSALENVTLPLELLALSPREVRNRGMEILGQLGLSNRAHHYPHQLSGGEQQRVAIGRAYIHEPRIIFADEPTGNLDPNTSAQILDSLLGLHQHRQTSLVLVTHDQVIAQRMQRQIAIKNGTCVTTSESQN
jgi:putative ABC transport system ATP-binding protein